VITVSTLQKMRMGLFLFEFTATKLPVKFQELEPRLTDSKVIKECHGWLHLHLMKDKWMKYKSITIGSPNAESNHGPLHY
jgi:hypothetical protein